jgi:predicted nucleic acid-binding protein
MSNHFLDTSGLVKHYHPEVGTAKVDKVWADADAKLFISRLSAVETISVLAKKVRTGVISAADFGLLLHTLDALQLAVALDLQKRGLLDEIIVADRVIVTLAALEGLKTSNPEAP